MPVHNGHKTLRILWHILITRQSLLPITKKPIMPQLFLIFTIVILFSTTAAGKLKKLDTEYFEVEYEEEAEKYVISSLKVLEFVRSQAIEQGFYLPPKLKFSVIRSNRNVLYFDHKKLKGITWEYNSLTNLLPPEKSRKKNVYGLCHELGHLCMYYITNNKNGWMTYEYRESWADFFGNYMIDSVYQYLGTNFWPEPHNYLETAGTDFLIKRLHQDKDKGELEGFNYSCLFWYELNEKIGFDNFSKFFNELAKQKVKNPDAKGKYLKVLTSFIDDNELSGWYNKYANYIILNTE